MDSFGTADQFSEEMKAEMRFLWDDTPITLFQGGGGSGKTVTRAQEG